MGIESIPCNDGLEPARRAVHAPSATRDCAIRTLNSRAMGQELQP